MSNVRSALRPFIPEKQLRRFRGSLCVLDHFLEEAREEYWGAFGDERVVAITIDEAECIIRLGSCVLQELRGYRAGTIPVG